MVKYSQPELKFWLASLVSTVLAQQQTYLDFYLQLGLQSFSFSASYCDIAVYLEGCKVYKISENAIFLQNTSGGYFCSNRRRSTCNLPPLNYLKAGFSSSKKSCLIWLNESPLKMMKSIFYFALKLLFFFKILKVFVLAFQSCRKNSLIRKIRFLSKFMTS